MISSTKELFLSSKMVLLGMARDTCLYGDRYAFEISRKSRISTGLLTTVQGIDWYMDPARLSPTNELKFVD